ncbi:ATP-binding protein [Streptomyces tritici]|uniref:ATP-binding protein n=1 Tax=Streptomyces tritici TaxID=2054410 RepID=UPI003AF05C48
MNGEAGRPTQLRRKVGGAELAAIPEVRHALRAMLRHWGEPGASDVAELLTSELVTNALIHTDRGAVVTATVVPGTRDTLRVEVRDFVPELPEPYVPHAPHADGGAHGAAAPADGPLVHEATHGRGLVLVEALADAWGIKATGPGKVVWFELAGAAA